MRGGHDYARTINPTRTALEECLAALEGGAHGICFSSGMGATTAIMELFEPGSRTVAINDVYGGTYRLFSKMYAPKGYDYEFVDLTRRGRRAQRVRASRLDLVWLETPSNPLLKIVDIAAVAERAHAAGALVVVDNTFASPYLQQPLALGADIVVHSTTKYVGGHSDSVGGAVIVNDDELARAAALRAELDGRRARAVRLLPHAARRQDARGAHGAPLRQRGRDRALARRSRRP